LANSFIHSFLSFPIKRVADKTSLYNTRSWPSGCGLSLLVNNMIRLNPSFCFLWQTTPDISMN